MKRILTAYAEPAGGPGWANSPVWVVWRDESGVIGVDCLQPDDLTAQMHTLYPCSAAAHHAMTTAVVRARPREYQR